MVPHYHGPRPLSAGGPSSDRPAVVVDSSGAPARRLSRDGRCRTLPQMPDQKPDEGEQWPYLSETLLWGTTEGTTARR